MILFLKTILISVLFIAPGNARDFKEVIQKGDELYKSFENKQALQYYLKAYEIAPDDYEVLLKVTRTYNDIGEEYVELEDNKNAELYINEAIKFAELFIKKYPESAAAHSYLAMSYGNLAMFKGGRDRVKLAHKIKDNASSSVEMNPNDYLPYLILGIYNREIAGLNWFERAFANTFFGEVPKGSYAESEMMFKKALSIMPDMIIALYHLSRTYQKMERKDDEVRLLRKVMNLPLRDFRDKYAKIKAQDRLKELGL